MPPKKILAIKLRALGDTVLMTAPLIELRRAYPEAEIHAAVLTSWAPLLENHPGVNHIWRYERHSDRASRAKAAARLAYRLRKEHFDCVVNFHASPSSSMISFATGARERSIHFHGHNDRNRYSTVEVPGKGVLKPIIERDMDTVRALGLHVPKGRLPQIFLNTSEKEWANNWLDRFNLPDPILAIGLGASRPTKCWPIDRFAQLAIQWSQKTGGGIVIIVGPGEGDLLHGFLKNVDDVLSATVSDTATRASIRERMTTAHALPIRQLAAVLSKVAVYAGNDSGPKHIAVSVGTPTVTVFGPEDPYEWHPYPQNRHPCLYLEDLACRKDADPGMPPWCGINDCVVEKHQCMRMIGVDSVYAACEKFVKPV